MAGQTSAAIVAGEEPAAKNPEVYYKVRHLSDCKIHLVPGWEPEMVDKVQVKDTIVRMHLIKEAKELLTFNCSGPVYREYLVSVVEDFSDSCSMEMIFFGVLVFENYMEQSSWQMGDSPSKWDAVVSELLFRVCPSPCS